MLDAVLAHFDPAALGDQFVAYLPNVFAALVLTLLFWLLIFFCRRALGLALNRGGLPQGSQKLLVRFAGYALFVAGALSVAAQLGLNVTSLVAGLGIAGLALSFAAQDTVANLISGITLAVDRPFKEGDWVCVDDIHAMVTETRLRTTVLTTFDNETIVVPNKNLAQQRIINYTLTPRIRMRVPIAVAFKESVDRARQVLLATLEGDTRILPDPAPTVITTQIGSHSVNLELRFWTENPLDKYPLQWEYSEKCKRALDEAGIQIPFPHLQLLLERSAGLDALSKS